MPAPRIPSGGTRGTVFRAIAEQRMLDAKTLLNSRRYNGAIYLAGYAIECHLKYGYCARKEEIYLPATCETHSWDFLIEAAGLSADLRTAPKILAIIPPWMTNGALHFGIACTHIGKMMPSAFTASSRSFICSCAS